MRSYSMAGGDLFGSEAENLSSSLSGEDIYASENARLMELAILKVAEYREALKKVNAIQDLRIKKEILDWIKSSNIENEAQQLESRIARKVPFIYIDSDMKLSTRRADDLSDFRSLNRELRKKLAQFAIILPPEKEVVVIEKVVQAANDKTPESQKPVSPMIYVGAGVLAVAALYLLLK